MNRHQSPVPTFGPEQKALRYQQSPHHNEQTSTREQRTTSVTPVSKVVKVTVHGHPSTTIKQVIRPVERRVLTKHQLQTVQLYEKPQEYITKERLDHSVTDTTSYLLMQKDMQIEHLQNENGRLMTNLHDLHCQVETWKIKYSNLEKEFMTKNDRTSEVETYKALLMENRECFQMEVQSLRYELSHQKQLYSQNESELQSKLDRQRSQLDEYENKLALFTTEIERMNCMLVQKQSIIDQLRIDEKEFKSLETQVRVRDDIIEERNNEITSLRRQTLRLSDLENIVFLCKTENDRLYYLIQQMETELNEQSTHSQRLESHIQTLSNEIQRLNSLLEQKSLEYRALETESQELLSTLKERDQYCDEIEAQLETLRAHLSQSETTLNGKNEQIKLQKDEITLLKSRVIELSNQIQFYVTDTEELLSSKNNLQDLLNVRGKDYAQLQSQLSELEAMSLKYRSEYENSNNKCQEYAQKLCLLSTEIENLTQKYKYKVKELEDLSNTCYELHQQGEAKDSEISLLLEKCKHIQQELNRISEYESNYYKMEDKCALLCSEVERLQANNMEREQRFNRLQNDYSDLEFQLQQTQESNQKNARLFASETETSTDLRQRLHEWEVRYQALLNDKQSLDQALEYEQRKVTNLLEDFKAQLQQVLKEKADYHQQCIALQEYHSKLETSLALLATENERLKQLLGTRNDTIEQLQSQVRDSEDKLMVQTYECERLVGELESKTEEWNRLNNSSMQRINLQDEKIAHLLEALKAKETELAKSEDNNQMMEVEIQRLNQLISEYQNEQGHRDQQLEELETCMIESRETTTYLTNELDSWKKKFVTLNREFHKTQEDYMMVQAEFDALKQRKLTTITSTKTLTFDAATRKSGANSIIIQSGDKENRKSIAPLSDLN